jgi:tRNA(Ile)-lysidine synthase
VRTLAVGAEVSRQDHEHLNRLATEAAPAVILAGHGGPARAIGFDRAGLSALPPALARRILRWALLDLGGRATSAHVAHLCRLLVDSPGAGLAVGRVLVDVTPSELRLSPPQPATGRPVKARWPWFGAGARAVRFALPIPGSVELPGGGGVVTVEALPSGAAPASHQADDALVDGAAAGSGLFVRFRRPGDRLRPQGLSGHKKLQDLLVDRKVPRGERDRVPLVVSADDRIVWVAGQALAADFAVSPSATGVLLLKFRRSGGKG